MAFATRFNKEKKFDIDTNGFGYKTLADMYNTYGKETVYPLKAVYINTKGKFADNPVFATDSEFVNIPAHMTDVARSIIVDEEAIKDINRGVVGFSIYEYENKTFHKTCYGVRFVDVPEGF